MGRYLKSGMGWMWILPFLFGCAAGPHPAPEALLCPHPAQEAVLWVQTAAENRAGAIQSYAAAERMLDAALADASWTAALEQTEEYEKLPPAVILDVDETVLDNSPFNARLVRENRSFDPVIWADWVGREAAEPIPAAREFIQTATDKGIAVFYITNRACPRHRAEGDCPQETATIRNLERCGFPSVNPDRMLLKNEHPDWGSEKAPRRKVVAETHRILMLIGDDLGDFIPGVRKGITPERRRELVDTYRDRWGKQWFVLSNPVYGSWRNILAEPALDNLRGYQP